MKKLTCSIFVGGCALGMGVSVYGLVRQYEEFKVIKASYQEKQERCNQIEGYIENVAYYEDLDKRYELEINSYEKYFPYYTYKSELFSQLLSFLETYPFKELQVTQGEEIEEDHLVSRTTYNITYSSTLDASRTLIKDLSTLSGMPRIQSLTMSHLDSEQIQTQFDISFKRRHEPFNKSEDDQ